ncbi:MAG: manganese-dependent inorganic pyrophosphatase [Lentimonas sp.]|jgi:manganese-dependent inorganic pyrophosphatase
MQLKAKTKIVPHYIVGHKNPDCDSVVSAHVLAWLHNQGNPSSKAIPLRLGAVNRQTTWLFEQAHCSLPQYRVTCRYRAGEICRPVPVVKQDCPLREALEIMQRAGTEFVAVVDPAGRPLGIISDRTQRTNYLLQCNVEDFIGTLLDFNHLIRGLQLTTIRSNPQLPKVDLLQVPLHKANIQGNWNNKTALIIGDRDQFLDKIRETPPAAIILTDIEDSRAEEIAHQLPCPVYRYHGTVIGMLTQLPGCFPASAAMDETFITVEEHSEEDRICHYMRKSPWGLLVIDAQGHAAGAISALDLLNLKRPKISLVDHSERGQSIDGLEDAEVIEIIDHHRLGDIETIQPLSIDVRPLGSTASILYDHIKEAGIEMPASIAKLLLGALISDTLLLTSPTCTQSDKKRATQLAATAGVKLRDFGLKVLKQNDELTTASPEVLVRHDCKPFTFESVQFLAAQIETVDLDVLDEALAAQLSEAFSHSLSASTAVFGALMITDVVKGRSRILLISSEDKWLRAQIPEVHLKRNTPWIIDEFVSRKKQLIPLLLNNIKKALDE